MSVAEPIVARNGVPQTRKYARQLRSSEPYEDLYRRLQFLEDVGDNRARLCGITACRNGDGASTTAINLALFASQVAQRPVLLVDANLRRPFVHRALRLKPGAGVAGILHGGVPVADVIQQSSIDNLSVIPAGAKATGQHRAYRSDCLHQALGMVEDEFEMIVLDLPAADDFGTFAVNPARLDGLVMVVAARRTPTALARRVKRRLQQIDARLLGVVLTHWQ